MKKGLLVVSIITVIVAVLGITCYTAMQARAFRTNRNSNLVVYRQGVLPMKAPGMMGNTRPFGPGMMDEQRAMKPGVRMMSPGWLKPGDREEINMPGPIRSAMVAALAKAFNMTAEELQSRLDAGDNPWKIAQEKSMTAEQFKQTMLDAHSEALKQAVAEGTITQAQAEWMSSHMLPRLNKGFEFGPQDCPMRDADDR